jgi:serine protease Do
VNARPLAAALAVCLLASCAGGPPARTPPTLPQARLNDVQAQVKAGSYLQALSAIDALRRDAPDVPGLDELRSQAMDGVAREFTAAIDKKDYPAALRLRDSAMALGLKDLGAAWTEKTLLQKIAAGQEASSEHLLALLTRLRVISLGDPSALDFKAAMAAARAAGNNAEIVSLASRMRERGLEPPAGVEPSAPSFPKMISGTVTILVNKGIEVEKGVGYPEQVIGSGFFIDQRGYILTNHHVIKSEVDPKYEGYSRLFIRLSESPAGERIPAKVVGWDATFDLALIKAEITPEYVFGGSSRQTLTPGDRIFAIGSPVGLEKTITSGIVSATGRRLQQVGDDIQVDVPLNPGNSGGPLLDEKGNLIGVVFAGIQQYQGLNFAIPYRWVEKALPLLYKGGGVAHPWMGMSAAETDKGLEVIYAVPDEPAAMAGIRAGDVIESVDGAAYTRLTDIQEAVLSHAPPTLVSVALRRGEARLTVLVCLSPRPEDPVSVALERDTRERVIYPLFGMQLESVGSFLWRGSYIVRRVTRGSIADESGISVDDPVTIQDWQVDREKGYAVMQIVLQKKKAGFVTSAIQIATYLETGSFI